jgi:hypothetical protein
MPGAESRQRTRCQLAELIQSKKYDAIQSWHGLPEHLKRQAVTDLLRSVEWHFWGVPVANPGKEKLLRWVPESVRQVLGPPETGSQRDLRNTNAAPEKRRERTPDRNAYEKSAVSCSREAASSRSPQDFAIAMPDLRT